jgi:hypothetical protein
MEKLNKKDKVTMFMINSMAMTIKYEVIFDHLTDTHIVFKMPRKRKLLQFQINDDLVLVFKGHDLNIDADSDGAVWRGNACLNLMSKLNKKDTIGYIERNNLKEITDRNKAHMMYMTPEQANDSSFDLKFDNCLYPEIESASNMVESIRRKK